MTMARKVVTMGVTEFKRNCSRVLLEMVDRDGSVVILTRHGKPVRKVIPVTAGGPGPVARGRRESAAARRMTLRDFRARCLAAFDDDAGTELVVSKGERPLARVVPVPRRRPKLHRPSLKKYVILGGDVESPIDVAWEANDW